MNRMQETKPSGGKWNQLLDEVVKNLKYKKITIDHFIYMKIFSGGNVSYLTLYIADVLTNTNNESEFPELRKVFEEGF